MKKSLIAVVSMALPFAAISGAALAQTVELRSPDGFIAVQGFVVDFDGTTLTVETSVGRLSVPAGEVACFGDGCEVLFERNPFGLSESDLLGMGLAVDDAPASVAEPAPAAAIPDSAPAPTASGGDYAVALARPEYAAIMTNLAASFAQSGAGAATGALSPGESLVVQAGENAATMRLSPAGGNADLTLTEAALGGADPAAYGSAAEWSADRNLKEQLIGVVPMVVAVTPNLEVDSISMADIAAIYAGEITNWSEIGGPDQRILPLQLPADSLYGTFLQERVMAPSGKAISPSVLTLKTPENLAQSVNQFPGAISVLAERVVQGGKVLSVAGECDVAVGNGPFEIASGDYPLLSPVVSAYRNGAASGAIGELFSHAGSPTAGGALEASGLAGLAVFEQPSEIKNQRLNALVSTALPEDVRVIAAQFFQRMLAANRLSATLYGGGVSATEAAWNRAMFDGLAAALDSGRYDGRELVFVGFSNDASALEDTQSAAEDMRAAFAGFAADALSERNIGTVAEGYGAIAAVSCIDARASADPATRIEVWVR